MKYSALLVLSLVASANAFAPSKNGRPETALSAEGKTFFNRVFELDLFAPVADQNDYGARKKKKLTQGKITDKSYIPSGLTKAQYAKLRAEEVARKNAKYQQNAKKAGVYEDFTEWYKKRGTDLGQGWTKSVTLGHRMAKTKYDWSGLSDKPLWAAQVQDKNGKKK